MSTTFPRRSAAESGCELSHVVALSSEGNSPSKGNGTAAGCLVASKSWFLFIMHAFPLFGCLSDARLYHAGRQHRCAYASPRDLGSDQPGERPSSAGRCLDMS